jgi:hypothetical protein
MTLPDENPGLCQETGECIAQDAGTPSSGAEGASGSGDSRAYNSGRGEDIAAEGMAVAFPIGRAFTLLSRAKWLRWLFRARGALPAARAGAGGTTRLYRAVSHAEFGELMKTGKFAAGPNSLGGKFFAESAEHAAQWGERLQGAGNYRIITVDVPTSAAGQFMRWVKLDAIGPARYAELEQLGSAVIGVFK